VSCPVCSIRKPKRPCPALNADICSQCCGEGREHTISCPLDCEFLLEARQHEKLVPMTAAESPHPDVEVTEQFLLQYQTQLILLTNAVFVSSVSTPNSNDSHIRAALNAIILARCEEPLPAISPEAQSIVAHFAENLEKLRKGLTDDARARFWNDAILLQLLVFLHRLAVGRDNGRIRGRAFTAFLEDHFKKTMGGG
jgi:hypothetical protein